jgi:hypothetical protein
MLDDIKEAVRIVLVFIICTLIFYYGIMWISEEYGPDSNKSVNNNAIKVNQSNVTYDNDELLRRIRIFFEYGE